RLPTGSRARAAARTGTRSTRSRPERAALPSPSGLVAPQLVVDAALDRRIERRGRCGRLAHAGPAPRPCADQDGRRRDPDDRQPPGQEPEAVVRRRGEDRVAVVRDEAVLDLLLAVTRG